jgi:hypothetical protein
MNKEINNVTSSCNSSTLTSPHICGSMWHRKIAQRLLVRKPAGKRRLGKPRGRWGK